MEIYIFKSQKKFVVLPGVCAVVDIHIVFLPCTTVDNDCAIFGRIYLWIMPYIGSQLYQQICPFYFATRIQG